nr:MAG TPA: intron associated endonuclease [Caudoviricetes sp.]
MVGIYKIENKVNGKVYIGQSIDIKIRWYNHRKELNGNRHHNEHLQNAWNKYGESQFIFNIIEECTVENIDEREIYWINYYNATNGKCGYNMTLGGQGIHGYSWSDEGKQHLSDIRNPEAILQLDLNGNIIERWRSGSYAARETGFPTSGIMNCLRDDGDQYQAHGFIWVYESKYYSKEFDINTYVDKYIKPRPRIIEYDLYGNINKIWNNAVEIMNEYGEKSVIYKALTCVLKHDRRSIKGKIFLYENDDFELTDKYLRDIRVKTASYKINQFDKMNNFIKTWTQEEIKNSEYLFSSIRHFCTQAYVGNFINKPLYNYIWRYE